MTDIVRKHIIFHGSVQGVGFRYYSEHKANQLRLTGWVKNLYNGDVEMEVQGLEAAIDELVAFLAGRRFVQGSWMWWKMNGVLGLTNPHSKIISTTRKQPRICYGYAALLYL